MRFESNEAKEHMGGRSDGLGAAERAALWGLDGECQTKLGLAHVEPIAACLRPPFGGRALWAI
jgi:hypothetical protein